MRIGQMLNMRSEQRQAGLASVEMMLIVPVLLLMMYIMVHSAKTMVTYEKRIIESRNAAYLTELYEGGEIQAIDRAWRTADETIQAGEQALADGFEELEQLQNLYEFNTIRTGDLPFVNGIPIQRYAMESSEGHDFYDEMIISTRDEMDDFSPTDDPNIMTDKIRNLSKVLTNDYSKSGATVGVSVSAYVGPLGNFTPFNGYITMRDRHTADFSNKMDLLDHRTNSQDVIDDGYNLKEGYSEELKEMLEWDDSDPADLFAGVFADTSNTEIAELGAFNVPIPEPVDVTVGINPPRAIEDDYDYSDCSGSYPGTNLRIPKCQPGSGSAAGKWLNGNGTQGAQGNSFWTPAPGTPRANALASEGASHIEFRNGYPVFEPFAYNNNGAFPNAVVTVPGMTGRQPYNKIGEGDFWKADEAYRQQLKNSGHPDWETWRRPAGYTWHHHQDCQTMILVRTDIHGNGLPHSGGASRIRDNAC